MCHSLTMHFRIPFSRFLLLSAILPLVLTDATSMPHSIRRSYPLTKANKAANRAVGEAEKAYQAASKAAEEAEKAYKSAVNAAKAARRAHKVMLQIENMDHRYKAEKPKSLFYRFNEKRRDNVTEIYSPEELIAVRIQYNSSQ